MNPTIDRHRLIRILDHIEAIGVEIAKLHQDLEESTGEFSRKFPQKNHCPACNGALDYEKETMHK